MDYNEIQSQDHIPGSFDGLALGRSGVRCERDTNGVWWIETATFLGLHGKMHGLNCPFQTDIDKFRTECEQGSWVVMWGAA